MTRVTCRSAAALLAAVLVVTAGACGDSSPARDSIDRDGAAATIVPAPAPTFDLSSGTITPLIVEVIATYPHDDDAYTQGLVYAGPGRLYETTGRYGHSSLREVAIETGEIQREVELDDTYFGEGLALSDGRLIALTWKENTALVFDPDTFEQIATHDYDTEGWGLCDDGRRLVMSDGSATLTFRDQQTFAAIGTVEVTSAGRPQAALNELECVDGLVYANVYLSDEIVVIDPTSGRVVGVVAAHNLLGAADAAELDDGEVLNGIAYDPDRGTFYLTGKHWPELFEVRFIPA